MPIYEYQCAACGHKEEFIQKISDKPLTKCPSCGKNKMEKQVSSTAFQLKGEGWYVTDFKNKKPTEKVIKETSSDTPATDVKVADPKKTDLSKKE